jgi:hypothetical protein
MYNIAKVAKGEILIYFNHIFDALCKVSHPSPPSLLSPSLIILPRDLAGRRLGVVCQEWRRVA